MYRFSGRVVVWVVLFLFFVANGSVLAVSVSVDPGGFSSRWTVAGHTKTGAAVVDIPSGQHRVRLGINADFWIGVAADGTVTVNNGVSGVGGVGTLTFNNSDLNVDPGAYPTRWWIAGGPSGVVGPGTVTVVPGVSYRLAVAYNNSGFWITVDGNGDVTSLAPASATTVGNTVFLNTTTLNVDPGAYPTRWWIVQGPSGVVGPGSVIVVPGVIYRLAVAYNNSGFWISVDDNGDVTSLSPASASTVGNTVFLNTTTLNVDPGDYPTRWWIVQGPSGIVGPGSVIVVPGVTYRLAVAYNNSGFWITVDDNGDVTTAATASADTAGNTVFLKTTPLNVDPGDYLGRWWITQGPMGVVGPGTIRVVPGVSYLLAVAYNNSGFWITVDDNGNVSTAASESATTDGNTVFLNTVTFTVDAGTYTGEWLINQGPPAVRGSGSIQVVPGLRFLFRAAGSHAWIQVGGEPCSVSPSLLTLGGNAFVLGCDSNSNEAPEVDGGGPYFVGEGGSVTLSATGSDPDGDALSYAWDLDGDNVFETLGQTVEFSAALLDGPSNHSVTVEVADEGGLMGYDDVAVEVENVSPQVSLFGPESGSVIEVHGSGLFEGGFSDPGVADSHEAFWTFSKAGAADVVVVGTVLGKDVVDEIVFSEPGIYSVTLTVTDDDGGVGSANVLATGDAATVVVVDPAGGFVTGGGWFDSPTGSLHELWDSSAEGRAHFGFVVQYLKNSGVLKGNLTFRFEGFKFKGSGFDWLVVDGSGGVARGTGLVNGEAGFDFLLSLVDEGKGNADRFRLAVWDDASGEVIYDNLRGAPYLVGLPDSTRIRKGDITIHTQGR